MKRLLLTKVFLVVLGAGISQAAITHISASGGDGGNTVNAGTDSATDWYVGGGNLNSDNLWGERGGFGENAEQIYECWGLVETLPQLKTTISGLIPGQPYKIWVNYVRFGYPSGNKRGGITAGLSLDNLYTFDEETGNDTIAGGSVLTGFTNSDRAGLRGYLDLAVADAGGNIVIYIDGLINEGEERAWYDGVSYEAFIPPTAWDPDPANKESDVETDLSARAITGELSWNAPTAYNDATYDIYFGTTEPNFNDPAPYGLTQLNIGDAQSATSIVPPVLDYETTYYWVVDAYEPNTVPILYQGSGWSFTTAPSDYAPTVTAGNNYITWLANLPQTINGMVNDLGEGDVENADVAWECSVPASNGTVRDG